MAMTVEQIEAEVLKLPEHARVELLDRLIAQSRGDFGDGVGRGRSMDAGGNTSR